MMGKGKKSIVTLFVSAVCLISGCSGGSAGSQGAQDAKSAVVNSEPVTVKLFSTQGMSDSDLSLLFIEPLKKKHPNITLEIIKSGPTTSIDTLIAAGNIPDIIYTWNGALTQFNTNDLLEDITPVTKKNNFDLNRFEPVVLDAVKVVSSKGELYALPFILNFNATFYNKDVFDRFGVAYPKDGMTWEDTIELAKKVTRMDGGKQYRGLDPDNINRMANPLSLTFVDARTGKATVNNESWRRIFELANQIWSIPGNKPEKMNVGGHNPFVKDKNIGMIAAQNIFSLGLEDATKEGMNWDLAQYPSYKEKPNVYGYVDTHILTITKSSKVKDQALQVIGTVTSEEIQTLMARKTGRVTTLKNQEIKQQLGADMPFLKGKNIPAVFKSKPAAAPAVSEYNLKARALVMTAFDEYMAGKDINTTLREVDEKINRMVETETKK